MNREAIIEFQGVTVPSRRDSESAVTDPVNWTVHRDDLWVIGGPQGVGKSDLIFLLAGLTKPIEGRYVLFGQDVGRRFGDEFLPDRLRTGLVFDDARLFNQLTLAENIALPISYHQNLTAEESAGWVNALVQETGVSFVANNTPMEVSRAWRQRAALARALALRPELLFLENPLRGVDARHVGWWVNFVGRLSRGHELLAGKKLTIIVCTDEFWPWRASGARFATMEDRQFTIVGDKPPPDHPHLTETITEG
jgi:ABC-type transporter Mla maintaining outer membrane lipid asymmetry ATPase subunit MlaF